jgi:hypothetical protein
MVSYSALLAVGVSGAARQRGESRRGCGVLAGIGVDLAAGAGRCAADADARVAAGGLWVPNRSSTAVTCGIARGWSSDMIADRGSTTALSDLPAAHSLARTAGP